MGDFNDGPGKEFFESRHLFLDLISNIQGSIFEADKYLGLGARDGVTGVSYPRRGLPETEDADRLSGTPEGRPTCL